MRFSSATELRAQPRHAITLFGMSGVGKTTLASRLQRDDWFQYSVDYRIGTRYMDEHIVDNFKREAMKVPLLRQLLRTDSITIRSNLSFENLSPLSTYLGTPGDPARGGISFQEYRRRQAQHRTAEISALLDVPAFIDRAHDIYGYQHFVCDAGGSLCEVVNVDDPHDPVLACLTQHTTLVYIEGTEAHTRQLVERFARHPKPMYYQPQFLEQAWAEFKALQGETDDDRIDPAAFARWGFEQLVRRRVPVYRAIADRHGYTISMDEAQQLNSDADLLALLGRTIEKGQP